MKIQNQPLTARKIIAGHYHVTMTAFHGLSRFAVITHKSDGWHADIRNGRETIRYAGIWDTLREALVELQHIQDA